MLVLVVVLLVVLALAALGVCMAVRYNSLLQARHLVREAHRQLANVRRERHLLVQSVLAERGAAELCAAVRAATAAHTPEEIGAAESLLSQEVLVTAAQLDETAHLLPELATLESRIAAAVRYHSHAVVVHNARRARPCSLPFRGLVAAEAPVRYRGVGPLEVLDREEYPDQDLSRVIPRVKSGDDRHDEEQGDRDPVGGR
ncbi:hypothetical protein [Brevibacterium litoralis]|uniref:hypothetical protein n=1 Tax=Brevibacterium litoralis TaxID=3138935 RepID=UPI0032ECC8C4